MVSGVLRLRLNCEAMPCNSLGRSPRSRAQSLNHDNVDRSFRFVSFRFVSSTSTSTAALSTSTIAGKTATTEARGQRRAALRSEVSGPFCSFPVPILVPAILFVSAPIPYRPMASADRRNVQHEERPGKHKPDELPTTLGTREGTLVFKTGAGTTPLAVSISHGTIGHLTFLPPTAIMETHWSTMIRESFCD